MQIFCSIEDPQKLRIFLKWFCCASHDGGCGWSGLQWWMFVLFIKNWTTSYQGNWITRDVHIMQLANAVLKRELFYLSNYQVCMWHTFSCIFNFWLTDKCRNPCAMVAFVKWIMPLELLDSDWQIRSVACQIETSVGWYYSLHSQHTYEHWKYDWGWNLKLFERETNACQRSQDLSSVSVLEWVNVDIECSM